MQRKYTSPACWLTGVGTKSLKDAECIRKALDQGKSDRIQVRRSSALGGKDSQNLFFLASLYADVNEQRDKGDGFGEHGSVAGQQSINQIRIFPPVVCNMLRCSGVEDKVNKKCGRIMFWMH